MERLTGWDYIAGVKTGDILNGVHEQVAFDRLAQIEDILCDEYDLDRLKELAEADKDGRCVVLPFKPPKMAWTCNANDPKPVKAFYSSAMGIMADMKAGCVFGDTPEAAEAALKAKSEGRQALIHPNDVGIIRYDYNHAKNKKEQVKILAQLYAVPRSEILGLLNIEEPEKKRAKQIHNKYTEETRKKLVRDVLSGMDVRIAAEYHNVTIGAAKYWMQKYRNGKAV